MLLSVCYPFIVYWGLQHHDFQNLLLLLLLVLILRYWLATERRERTVIIFTVLAVGLISWLVDGQVGLKIYPVMINVGFLAVFVHSLYFPPNIIERFARLSEPNLSPKMLSYTHKVTWVWIGFFLLNGSISTATTLWATNEIWVFYNGFIAYILMGSLFAGEWLVRRYRLKITSNG